MRKFVVVYSDEEGFECWREEFSIGDAYKFGYGNVIDEMIADGVRVRRIGDVIYELF